MKKFHTYYLLLATYSLFAFAALTAEAVEYTYTDPVWYVEATSATNEIATATFTKSVGGVESESSWTEFSAATTGTLVKRGANCVRIEQSLVNFMGEVHVEAGVLYVKNYYGLGNLKGGNIFVHQDATIVMHRNSSDGNLPKEGSAPYNKNISKCFFLDSQGAPGELGTLIFKDEQNTSEKNWFMMTGLNLYSDATICVDAVSPFGNWRPQVTNHLNGFQLNFRGGSSWTPPEIRGQRHVQLAFRWFDCGQRRTPLRDVRFVN